MFGRVPLWYGTCLTGVLARYVQKQGSRSRRLPGRGLDEEPAILEQGMRCPYLKDARVKYCRVSAFKKMIERTPRQADHEKCSSEDYAACEVARQHGVAGDIQSRCPYLEESQAQYCAAASVTKFIPYSEAGLSRCGGEGYRSCELYAARREGRSGP